mgnify:CR=1 FL=1
MNQEVSSRTASGDFGQIVEIVDETFQIAKVDGGGVKRGVSIALIASESVAPGWIYAPPSL